MQEELVPEHTKRKVSVLVSEIETLKAMLFDLEQKNNALSEKNKKLAEIICEQETQVS